MASQYDLIFSAYEEYKQKLIEDPVYVKLTKEIGLASKAKDTCTGSVSHKTIDLDWVEAIEAGLPYIDIAIREQRRFFENNEEIVSIERARRITSESVKHLAQHTSMISKVEGDTVTPERILNITRDESFAVYENRFLYTLILNLTNFIDKRFEVLKDVSDDASFRFTMNRSFRLNTESVGIDLGYSFIKHEKETTLDLSTDITQLNEYERVLRIRKITADFLNTPLMRALKGVELIRPPIVKTNSMKKNPNLIQAVELYTFIEQYSRPGYTIVSEQGDGVLDLTVKNELNNVFALAYFIVKICTDRGFRNILSQSYLHRVNQIKEAQQDEESSRISKLRYLLDAARKEEAAKFLAEIDKLKGQIVLLQEKLNYYKMNYIRQTRTVNKLSVSLKRLAKKLESEKAFAETLRDKEVDSLKDRWEDFVSHEKDMRDEQLVQVQNACRKQLSKQKTQHLKEIEKLQKLHKQELAVQKDKYEKQIAELKKSK